MPPLPIELQLQILSYALPEAIPALPRCSRVLPAADRSPASWTGFSLRSEWLYAWSLVSRPWRDWAQRELHRHVVLRSEDAVRCFLHSFPPRAPDDSRPPFIVETVRVGGVDEHGQWMDGSRIGDVLERIQPPNTNVGPDGGIRQVWLIQVANVDLRALKHLDDLRVLICASVSLSIPAHKPQAPVDSWPPRLPKLHTLVLKQVQISPFMRTILYESHAFDELRVLAFDHAEVLEQVFDANPEGLPRLVAMRPAADLRLSYYPALDKEADSESDGDSDEGGETDRDRTGLLYLSASSGFLIALPSCAPWLPASIQRLSFDCDCGEDELEFEEFMYAANELSESMPIAATEEPLAEVPAFLNQLDEVILPASFLVPPREAFPGTSRRRAGAPPPHGRPTLVHPLSTRVAPDLPTSIRYFFESIRDRLRVPLCGPPCGAEEGASDDLAPQDRLVPWRFLIEADETLRALEAGSGRYTAAWRARIAG